MSTLTNIKPANYDITYYKGDTFDLSFSVSYDSGTAYDLSGKSIKMQIKRSRGDSVSVDELTTADGDMSISGASNNIITFDCIPVVDAATYDYDIEIDTDDYTIVYGQFKVTGDTTR